MSRRGVSYRDVCAHEGCRDTQFHQFDSQQEYTEFLKNRRARGDVYRCTRHRDPAKNLRLDNTVTEHVAIATKAFSRTGSPLSGLFWYPEGAKTGSGFEFGPGFNAHAEDFPEGTRLVVTARIEMPS